MPERLSRRLVGVDGGPSRTAVAASLAIVMAAFAVAFAIALGSAGAEPRPPAPFATKQPGAPSHQERSAELRRVPALPELRPAPQPQPRPPLARAAHEGDARAGAGRR